MRHESSLHGALPSLASLLNAVCFGFFFAVIIHVALDVGAHGLYGRERVTVAVH